MKKIVYIFCVTIGIVSQILVGANETKAQWQHTTGPTGGNIACIAVSGSDIYAVANNQIYYSANNGASWSNIANFSYNIRAIAANKPYIYLGTGIGTYVSNDNGASWTMVSSMEPNTIVIDGSNIFAGENGGGIALSTDNGTSWAEMDSGFTTSDPYFSVNSIAINGNNIYAGTRDGLYLSTNNAVSWVPLTTGLPADMQISAVAVSDSNIIVGSIGMGLYVSNNNGASFTVVNGINASIYALAANGTHIFAGTQPSGSSPSGMYVSTDNSGSNWNRENYGLADTSVTSLCVNGGNVFAGTSNSIFLSNNNGASWTNAGVPCFNVLALAKYGNNILAGSSGSDGISLSSNNGASWKNVLGGGAIASFAISGNNIFAGTYGYYMGDIDMFLSTNNGVNWGEVSQGITGWGFGSLATHGTNIFAGTYTGVYLSTSNGTNWAAVNTGLTNDTVNTLAVKGDSLYAGTNGGVFLSGNNGTNWTAVNTGLTNSKVYSLVIGKGNIFAGTNGGVFLSSNYGASWTAKNNGLTNDTVISLTMGGDTVYAGTKGGGVFISTNSGTNWIPINDGLMNEYINSLMISNDTIYAGTNGYVWKRSIQGIIPLTIAASAGTICAGSSTTLTASGATTYSWSNGLGSANPLVVSPTATTTYTVTGTSTSGTASASITVTVNQNPTPLISPPTGHCFGDIGFLMASTSDSYLWNTEETTQDISVSTSGTYTVTVSLGGCTGSSSIVVNFDKPTPVITGPTSICSGSTATLDAGAGYLSYYWNTGVSTETVAPTAAGTWSVTVTDSYSCIGTASFTINSGTSPTLTISGSTNICSGTPATLDAGAGYSSYLWSTNATSETISVTTAGTYTVTVSNSSGCTGSASVSVYEINPVPDINGPTSICQGSFTGLTASTSNSYLWSTGSTTQTISVTTAGTYTVTVSLGGCTGSTSTTVSVNPNPTPTITGPTTMCPGSQTILDAGTGYSSYYWNTGASTETMAPTAAGTWSVTVSNSSGCSGTASITINSGTSPTPTISGSTNICSGTPATLDAGAGYSSYLWSANATSETISVTTSGTYTVTVSNSSGCTGSASVSVYEINPVPHINGPTSICPGSSGTLMAFTSDSYLWSTGATTQSISVSAAGTYSVTVTLLGCSGSTSTVVNIDSPAPIITGPTTICSGSTATLDAGSGYSSYFWTTGSYNEAVTVSSVKDTNFTVTVTDSLGCSGSASIAINVNPVPTPTITGNLALCAGSTGTLDAGAGYTSYSWNTGATTETISITLSVTYMVTVTNSYGCIGSAYEVELYKPSPSSQFTSNVSTNTVNYTSTSGTGNIYFWDFGDGTISNQADPVHTFNSDGYFNTCLTVTDTVYGYGCQSNYCSNVLIGSPTTACLAKFGYSLAGNTVTFSDSSLGSPDHWYWQFGDATSSTLQNPVHTFNYNGIYNASLTISNSTTNCSDNYSMHLSINNVNDCFSDFLYNSSPTCNIVDFTDHSRGDINSYLWNFGDNSTAAVADTYHIFPQAGYYNVCHTVFNTTTGCYNMVCKEITVGSSGYDCKANFVFTIDSVTKTVQFSDCSFGSPDEWTWDFGDNTSSYVQNPTHTYSSNGIYSVQLNILNDIDNCSDFIVMQVNVNSTQSLNCGFGYTSNASGSKVKGGTQQYPVDFVAAVFGDPKKYVWNFGDGSKDSSTTTPVHLYDSIGTYNVCLYVADPTINESDLYCKQVEVSVITNINDYLQLNIDIYPNPANDNITIENSFFTKNESISIYDIQGQLLMKLPVLQAKTNINISAFSKGLYFLKVENDKGFAIKKFVKE